MAPINFRKAARGRPCTVRIPNVCDGGGETTVLSHYRLAGYSGVGMKPDDVAFGAWACAPCHDAIDGRLRVTQHAPGQLRLWHAEGVLRTIAALRKERLL